MRNTLYILISLLIFSCGKKEQIEAFQSCFEIDKEFIEVGEELHITDCSVGAVAYEYTYANNFITITESSPTLIFEHHGEANIQLTVTASDGRRKVTTKTVVVGDIRNNYIISPEQNEKMTSPLSFGINSNNEFYYLESFSNIETGNKYINYVNLGESMNTFDKQYLSNRTYNTGNSLYIEYNNLKTVYFDQSMQSFIGAKKLEFDDNWNLISNSNYGAKNIHGVLETNGEYLEYGVSRSSLIHNPVIYRRNSMGALIEEYNYPDFNGAYIGDMIPLGDGYIAFGGKFDQEGSAFKNFETLLIYFNSNLEITNYITYDCENVPSSTFNSIIRHSAHIIQLENSNLVMYSQGLLRIVSVDGTDITSVVLSSYQNNQALVGIGDNEFALTEYSYLSKYDGEGNLLKRINFMGHYTPELIYKDDQIFFASNLSTTYQSGTISLQSSHSFIGAVDRELNVIDLN